MYPHSRIIREILDNSVFIKVQTKEISEKKEVVLADLAKVEPAVQDAQQGTYFSITCLC